MPNLSPLRPVEMYRCVFGSTSGLTRKLIGARLPREPATRFKCSSSLADSRLKHSIPSCSALAISASVLPTPENRIRAGSDRARKLAARHDVEAAAQAREQVDDRQIRVGFHRVADQVGQAGECAIERRKGTFDRGAGIDEARSAVLRGDLSERNALGGELAVAIVERGHCLPAPDDPGAVGGSAGGGEDGVDDGGGVVSG